jgi:hypothetical protein
MPTDASFSPWLLWTLVVLAAGAIVGLLVGVWQSRRPRPTAPPTLTFQPVPGAPAVGPAAPGSGRPSKPPAFMPPPAPLAPALGDNQAEQRTFYRRVGNAVLVLLADADDHRRPRNAWVIDRSRDGLRLAAEQELPVGKVYSVRPAQAPPATPWTAVEVRHCTEVDGHWEAGCRFLQPPPVTVLMLFG